MVESTQATLTPAVGRLNSQMNILAERTGFLEQMSGTMDRVLPIMEGRLGEASQGILKLGQHTQVAVTNMEGQIKNYRVITKKFEVTWKV